MSADRGIAALCSRTTCVFFQKKEEPMATIDNFFVATGPGPLFAGLQSIPFDRQTAVFRVGVYATGQKFGVQGVALSNAGDTIDVQEFGRAGGYGGRTASLWVNGGAHESD